MNMHTISKDTRTVAQRYQDARKEMRHMKRTQALHYARYGVLATMAARVLRERDDIRIRVESDDYADYADHTNCGDNCTVKNPCKYCAETVRKLQSGEWGIYGVILEAKTTETRTRKVWESSQWRVISEEHEIWYVMDSVWGFLGTDWDAEVSGLTDYYTNDILDYARAN